MQHHQLFVFVHGLIGLVAGAGIALVHAGACRHATTRALARDSPSPLAFAGFLVRVGLPAAALFLLVALSHAALLAGLLGFLVAQLVLFSPRPSP